MLNNFSALYWLHCWGYLLFSILSHSLIPSSAHHHRFLYKTHKFSMKLLFVVFCLFVFLKKLDWQVVLLVRYWCTSCTLKPVTSVNIRVATILTLATLLKSSKPSVLQSWKFLKIWKMEKSYNVNEKIQK